MWRDDFTQGHIWQPPRKLKATENQQQFLENSSLTFLSEVNLQILGDIKYDFVLIDFFSFLYSEIHSSPPQIRKVTQFCSIHIFSPKSSPAPMFNQISSTPPTNSFYLCYSFAIYFFRSKTSKVHTYCNALVSPIIVDPICHIVAFACLGFM